MITVQYTRYFEEFGMNDIDIAEFDNINDANAFYNKHITTDPTVKMFIGKDRIM